MTTKQRDWVTAGAISLVALCFRLWHLGRIKGFIFDEVYYAKDARSLALHGVEMVNSSTASYVVHPPVGKWLIAIGVKLFGFNEFGWRFTAAVIGSLSIAVMYFTTRKLFNNYLLSSTAAIFMTFDGLELVQSRTALLDIFLMFFLQIAFLSLIYSQHWLAGSLLGLAAATKWTGLYYMVAFGAFMVYADFRRRQTQSRIAESRFNFDIWIRDIGYRALQYLVIPVAIYIASWAGWFFTKTGWDRDWANLQKSRFSYVPAVFRSWFHYQAQVLDFHRHLTTAHPYSANPWGWLVMARPTAFLYQSPQSCGAPTCSQEILALGTPLLWWSATVALFVTFGYWVARREWQSGLLLLAVSAGYLPWFLFQKRTMFTFYAIAFEPFMILILIFALSKALESARNPRSLRLRQWTIGALVLLVGLNFLYFLPLYIGTPMSYSSWHAHLWLPSWF